MARDPDRPGSSDDRADARLTRRRARILAGVVAAVGAAAVFLLATEVFPYHSLNDDEGVYLQQAAMLLEGRLFLDPPVPDAFRPWFFVDEPQGHPPLVAGGDLYSKYAPVAPATFAVGKLLGGYRIALALIAAANLALTYAVASEAFDRRHGLLAAGFLLLSPLFLVDSAVFLAYAPTTAWNLLFAFGYLRADRLGRAGEAERARQYAALAGLGVGVAFFSRPFTAVLFAAPFVLHALWTLRPAGRRAPDAGPIDQRWSVRRRALARHLRTGALGLAGVAASLGYNAAVTGDPLLFPYRAFAPEDGLGFGHRQLLGYGRQYTPELALRANARVLDAFFAEWVAAGALGSALAAVGVVVLLARLGGGRIDARPGASRRLALAGLFVSIPAGNVLFWGNLNILGRLSDPGDGLIALLGPYYHFDLLVPVAAFAAAGAVALSEFARTLVRSRLDPQRARVALAVGLLVSASLFGVAAVGAAREPIEDNRDVTRQLSAAYQPFEERSYDGAVVFLPTPYGDWMNHPFQALRNDPGFDGDTVYALRENQFATVDAFPNRTYYRYTYRGRWAPQFGGPVEPRIQRVEHVRGEQISVRTDLGIPSGAESVSIRLSSGENQTYYAANGTPETLPLTLRVEDGRARVTGPVAATDGAAIPVGDAGDVRLTAFVDYGTGNGFSYRIELPTKRADGEVRAVTPYVEVCRVATRCGGEAAYVPSTTRPGVVANVSVRADS